MENDGTFRCKRCRLGLNETDANCWRCGSRDIEDLRPKPLELGDLIIGDQVGVEEVLRSWTGTTGTFTWTITT